MIFALILAVLLGVILGAIFTAWRLESLFQERLIARDQMWQQALTQARSSEVVRVGPGGAGGNIGHGDGAGGVVVVRYPV